MDKQADEKVLKALLIRHLNGLTHLERKIVLEIVKQEFLDYEEVRVWSFLGKVVDAGEICFVSPYITLTAIVEEFSSWPKHLSKLGASYDFGDMLDEKTRKTLQNLFIEYFKSLGRNVELGEVILGQQEGVQNFDLLGTIIEVEGFYSVNLNVIPGGTNHLSDSDLPKLGDSFDFDINEE